MKKIIKKIVREIITLLIAFLLVMAIGLIIDNRSNIQPQSIKKVVIDLKD